MTARIPDSVTTGPRARATLAQRQSPQTAPLPAQMRWMHDPGPHPLQRARRSSGFVPDAGARPIPSPNPTPGNGQSGNGQIGNGQGGQTSRDTQTPKSEPSPKPPEPTQEPPPPQGPIAITQPDRTNVRLGPGTVYRIVRSVPHGTRAQIICVGPWADWYEVKIGGVYGTVWIKRDLTVLVGSLDGSAATAPGLSPSKPGLGP